MEILNILSEAVKTNYVAMNEETEEEWCIHCGADLVEGLGTHEVDCAVLLAESVDELSAKDLLQKLIEEAKAENNESIQHTRFISHLEEALAELEN
jgi:hypothetical protein